MGFEQDRAARVLVLARGLFSLRPDRSKFIRRHTNAQAVMNEKLIEIFKRRVLSGLQGGSRNTAIPTKPNAQPMRMIRQPECRDRGRAARSCSIVTLDASPESTPDGHGNEMGLTFLWFKI